MHRCLTIAGSDSGGGAGIQADLKTFMALGAHGSCAITALTAQNTMGVLDIIPCEPEFVARQIEAVMTDIGADAAKTGMLAEAGIIEAVAAALERWPIPKLVVDPVMIATSGARLIAPDAVAALINKLLPMATLITPNLPEAEALTGVRIETLEDRRMAAAAIVSMGARAALIKGGHSRDADRSDDLLYDGREFTLFEGPRIDSPNTHGSGCTLSAAIAALLAKGRPLREAIERAKSFVAGAIRHSHPIGEGPGPVNQAWNFDHR